MRGSHRPQPSSADNHAGDRLVQELLWIHGILRDDLQVTRRLADEVLTGKDPASVHEEVTRLQTQSPLWQLRANCLRYCRLVHLHHRGEDAHFFPALRRSHPALGPVVDKLESDHRRVSDILDEVEAAVRELQRHDDPGHRRRVVAALQLLSDHLLAHLDYEEENITPTLQTWDSWPFL